ERGGIEETPHHHLVAHDQNQDSGHEHRDIGESFRNPVDDGKQLGDHAAGPLVEPCVSRSPGFPRPCPTCPETRNRTRQTSPSMDCPSPSARPPSSPTSRASLS